MADVLDFVSLQEIRDRVGGFIHSEPSITARGLETYAPLPGFWERVAEFANQESTVQFSRALNAIFDFGEKSPTSDFDCAYWGEKIGVKPGIFLIASVVLGYDYTRGELIPHINLRMKKEK